jgi:glutathione S-transferase
MHTPDDLALYYYDGCPACGRVIRALERLGVQVEMRNVLREPRNMQELVAARGRRTVPVMRLGRDGDHEWMPESRDIVAYLERRFAT